MIPEVIVDMVYLASVEPANPLGELAFTHMSIKIQHYVALRGKRSRRENKFHLIPGHIQQTSIFEEASKYPGGPH
jgi:hypothetical protein